jgi:hypothetical protein
MAMSYHVNLITFLQGISSMINGKIYGTVISFKVFDIGKRTREHLDCLRNAGIAPNYHYARVVAELSERPGRGSGFQRLQVEVAWDVVGM